MPHRSKTVGRAVPVLMLTALLSSWGGLVAGCSMLPTALLSGPEVTYARQFPPDLLQHEQLNIQARREGYEMTLTNTTAERFEASTVWINQRYGYPIPSLDIGQRITLDMREFVDQFSEHFRGGGFFATQRPDDAMLVQLETERDGEIVLLGLVSVGDTPI